MVGASFLTFIWIALGEVTAVFVVLMIWKSVTGVPEENFVILDAAQMRPVSQHQAIAARVERLARLAKYCGYASLGLLVISGGVWVVPRHNRSQPRPDAVKGPGVGLECRNALAVAMGRGA